MRKYSKFTGMTHFPSDEPTHPHTQYIHHTFYHTPHPHPPHTYTHTYPTYTHHTYHTHTHHTLTYTLYTSYTHMSYTDTHHTHTTTYRHMYIYTHTHIIYTHIQISHPHIGILPSFSTSLHIPIHTTQYMIHIYTNILPVPHMHIHKRVQSMYLLPYPFILPMQWIFS